MVNFRIGHGHTFDGEICTFYNLCWSTVVWIKKDREMEYELKCGTEKYSTSQLYEGKVSWRRITFN
jgi:hypothetical protein